MAGRRAKAFSALTIAVSLGLPVCASEASADAVVATVTVAGSPFATVSSHDGDTLFVSISRGNGGSNTGVVVLHRTGREFEKTGFVSLRTLGAFGMALTPDESTLLVADGEGVALIDAVAAKTAHAADPVYVVDGANAGAIEVVVTPDGGRAFVSDESRAQVSVIELKRQTNGDPGAVRTGQIAVDRGPVGLALSPDGATLYVTSELAPRGGATIDADADLNRPCAQRNVPRGTLTAIDVATQAVVARLVAGCSPVRVVVTADGTRAWVSVRGEDRIVAFDTSKILTDPAHAFVSQARVGSAPVGLALLAHDTLLAVSNSNRFDTTSQTSTVNVISLDGTFATRATFSTGMFPREFSVSPDSQTLYLTNFLSGTVQIVDIGRL